MRLVQTFWTGGKNPLGEAFGWHSAEEHLMGWTLSSLSLCKHYDNVVLYTDSAGKDVLIDRLGLPYSEVHVVFDDFPFLPQHWALAKIQTYSLQTEPFLHVDADVFAAQPFPDCLLQASLAVQNVERGTRYYREMVDRMLAHGEFQFPGFVQSRIGHESLPSYNMGIFGGHDTVFIRQYCEAAMDFAAANHLNDQCDPRSAANCNVFVEQILLAMMAEEKNRIVTPLIERVIDDNRYTTGDFCYLKDFDRRPYFHLIGGHKRNETVCSQMARQLLIQYPEYYLRLKTLFPERHKRMAAQVATPAERAITAYHDLLAEQEIRWRRLNPEVILERERSAAYGVQLLERGELSGKPLSSTPDITYYAIPAEWPATAVEWLKTRLNLDHRRTLLGVVFVPTIQDCGIHEVAISPLASNILSLLNAGRFTFETLSEELRPCFSQTKLSLKEKENEMIRSEVAYLLFHGLVLPDSPYDSLEHIQ